MKYSKTTQAFYPSDIFYPNLPSDLIEVDEVTYVLALELRSNGSKLDVVAGQLVIIPPAPSPAHDWNGTKWVLNKVKQIESEKAALATAKAEAMVESIKYADDLQASILGSTSAAAQARLDNKYTAACAIKDSTATAGDKAVIETEVATRPKYTEAQLVDVIIAKGTAAKKAEGLINGMLLLAQDGIEAAQSLEQLASTVAAIKEKSDGLKTQLLATLGG